MSDSQCGYVCCPNKSNGEIIAAQFLSIVACVIAICCLFTSPSGFELRLIFFSWILMIFYQVLWCVRIPKKLHWALIVPTFIISGCNFYIAIVWVIVSDGDGFLIPFSLLYWVPAVLWLVAAILQLVFVFKKSNIKENTEDADNVDAGEDV